MTGSFQRLFTLTSAVAAWATPVLADARCAAQERSWTVNTSVTYALRSADGQAVPALLQTISQARQITLTRGELTLAPNDSFVATLRVFDVTAGRNGAGTATDYSVQGIYRVTDKKIELTSSDGYAVQLRRESGDARLEGRSIIRLPCLLDTMAIVSFVRMSPMTAK